MQQDVSERWGWEDERRVPGISVNLLADGGVAFADPAGARAPVHLWAGRIAETSC